MAGRRRFLGGLVAATAATLGRNSAPGAALAAFVVAAAAPGARAEPVWSAYPFSLGVASGSPAADGMVLWTRLAPRPEDDEGPGEALRVRWELARDEGFAGIVRSGQAVAEARTAHSVHVELAGLDPDRVYWYRFMSGDAVSPTGRTRTLPAAASPTARLRFAFASCQHWEHGLFGAYVAMAADEPDLVVFLGDYIYEGAGRPGHGRQHSGGECRSLADYRRRHALYKSDPALQRMHAAAPWLLTWDDHEVANDYANDRPVHPQDDFLARRAAAYQAYYEHMPLRRDCLVAGIGAPQLRIHARYDFGRLARFHVLDGRQYRSHQPCAPAGRGGAHTPFEADCPDRLDAAASYLGAEQEQWLAAGLRGSPARWNILAQQTLMAQLDRDPGPARRFWTDGWDGYPAARQRLLRVIERERPGNPVVIGGDVHAWWVCDLKSDWDAAEAAVLASEFCGTSLSSQGASQSRTEAIMAANPQVRYARSDTRGYTLAEIEPGRMTVKLRGIDNVWRQGPAVATVASFVVEDGRPGARRSG